MKPESIGSPPEVCSMFFKLLKDWNGQKAGTQLTLSDSDAAPLVQAGVMEAVRDDPLTPIITRGVENALNGFQKGLDGIIAATLKRFADAQAQSRRAGNPIIFGENGDGDSKKRFGDWLLGVARNDRGYLEKHYGSNFNEWSQKAAISVLKSSRQRPNASACAVLPSAGTRNRISCENGPAAIESDQVVHDHERSGGIVVRPQQASVRNTAVDVTDARKVCWCPRPAK